MTLFSLYEGKLIRLTDDQGNIFTGVADTFPAEYGMHELGREEEGIRLNRQNRQKDRQNRQIIRQI